MIDMETLDGTDNNPIEPWLETWMEIIFSDRLIECTPIKGNWNW